MFPHSSLVKRPISRRTSHGQSLTFNQHLTRDTAFFQMIWKKLNDKILPQNMNELFSPFWGLYIGSSQPWTWRFHAVPWTKSCKFLQWYKVENFRTLMSFLAAKTIVKVIYDDGLFCSIPSLFVTFEREAALV